MVCEHIDKMLMLKKCSAWSYRYKIGGKRFLKGRTSIRANRSTFKCSPDTQYSSQQTSPSGHCAFTTTSTPSEIPLPMGNPKCPTDLELPAYLLHTNVLSYSTHTTFKISSLKTCNTKSETTLICFKCVGHLD